MNPAQVALAQLDAILDEQPAAAPPAAPVSEAQQPAQLRCSKRARVAPPPVAEFARGTEVEALWEGKWYPGVVAEVVV